jgi:hypothetical protein
MCAILYGAIQEQTRSTRFGPFVCRLHGGTDFGTPLLIQKVGTNALPASPARFLSSILLYLYLLTHPQRYLYICKEYHIHRVAMATYWRIFHHDGKVSPGGG